MAVIYLKNRASGTLSTAISAADTGIALTYGDGAEFPTITASDYYFYATIESTAGTSEIVKVTARSGDSLTVTRAQEGTTAAAFAAGSRFEQRVTAQSIIDKITDSSVTLAGTNSWTGVQTFGGATTEIYKSGSAAKLRIFGTGGSLYHGLRTVTSTLTFDYGGTDYLTATSAGVVSFVNTPLVGASSIYYASGTDVAVTDGGTGSSTASGARTNLGIVIGTDVQAYDAGLLSIAGLTTGADKMIYTTALDVYATADLTSFARTILDDANAAATRTTLGLGTIATQAASAVAVTGGTVEGLTSLQGRRKISSETTGVLTALSANTTVFMTGDCTLNASVFTAADEIWFYSGASARTLTQGSGVTLRLGGSATTGSRTIAARTWFQVLVVTASEFVATGTGVT